MNPLGNNPAEPINVGGTTQYKSGAFGVGGAFRAYSTAVIDGSLTVQGQGVCLGNGSNCPASPGETDPTVPSSIKDGISWGEVSSKPDTATRWPNWSEIANMPGGFADGVDNTGITSVSAYARARTCVGPPCTISCDAGEYFGSRR